MKKLVSATLLFLLIGVVFIISTKEVVESINYDPVTHKDVFKAKCVSCHSYLNESDSYLINMGYVKPGNPARSIIFRYLKGANVGGPENMPPRHTFKPKELELIKKWIVELKNTENSEIYVEVKSKPVKKLSDIEVLNRCSLQFTNLSIKESSKDLFEEVKKENITGDQGCLQLLGKVSFDKNGILNTKTEVTKNILTNFQKIHNNWFNEWNFFTSMSTWGTFELLDPGVMGFYFTRSLFDKKYSVKDVFKGNQAYEGVRHSEIPQGYLQYKFKEEPRYKVSDYRFIYGLSKNGEYKEWHPKRVSSGELIGVQKIPRDRDVLPFMVNSKDNQVEIKPADEIKVYKDVHKGLGGGLLGNESYVSLNLGQDLGKQMDGGRVIPRRWATAVVKELLCRDLPVVSLDTAKSFVQKESSLSFRRKASCMACHATMDNMAYLVRNVEQGYSADAGGDGMIHSTHLRTYYPKNYLKSESIAPDKDTKFHLRAPRGMFVYKDLYGNEYNEQVETLDELGKFISQLDDFYLCTAKKYFSFLTGTDVSMNIFSSTKLSKKDIYYKELLESSAKKIKESGDLLKGIEVLVKSDVYQSRSFDVEIE